MSTIQNLFEMYRTGKRPVVTFKAAVDELESYAEAGMKAVLVGAELRQDDVVSLTFDFTDYDEYNQVFESRNYYDKSGNPTLTAREAGFYKPTESVYVMATDPMTKYCDLDSDDALVLMAEYRAARSASSYVAWLEQQILEARVAA